MRKDLKLFQHGTLAMLVAGLFDGTIERYSSEIWHLDKVEVDAGKA
ncbi:hypothetical protein [Lactobacillus delbrueckii]|jgi:hypothetical protein|nr:hypothetical protein [Lactobacillus delbrueckii]MCD5452284.1 hypothetical protein [Lactobacillus delbrueckii subsp. lactis]